MLSYGISFYRERFQIPKGWASLILSGLALAFIFTALRARIGVVLGILGVLAALVIRLYATDPTEG